MPEFKVRDLMIDVLVQDLDLHCRIFNTCGYISPLDDICKRIHSCFRYLSCKYFLTPPCRYHCSLLRTIPPIEACEGPSIIDPTIIDIGETIRYQVDETQILVDVGALVINPGNIEAVRKQLNEVLDNAQKVGADKAKDLQKEAASLADSLTKAAEQLRSLKK